MNYYNKLLVSLTNAKKCNSKIMAKKHLLIFLNNFKIFIEKINKYEDLTEIIIFDKCSIFSSQEKIINKKSADIKLVTNGLFAQVLEYIRIENYNEISDTLKQFTIDLESDLSLNKDLKNSKQKLISFINNIIDTVDNTEVYE